MWIALLRAASTSPTSTNTVNNFAKLTVNMSNKVALSKFTNTVGNFAKLPVNLNNKIKLR